MRSSERFTSVLGRISRRLAADPEMRVVRERLEERLAQARAELEATQRDRESAARARTARREAEWQRLMNSPWGALHTDARRPAAVLRWQKRGSA